MDGDASCGGFKSLPPFISQLSNPKTLRPTLTRLLAEAERSPADTSTSSNGHLSDLRVPAVSLLRQLYSRLPAGVARRCEDSEEERMTL